MLQPSKVWRGSPKGHHKGIYLGDITKQRNSYFFQLFFLENRNSQRNKFSWYWFCWEICGICNEGLQTWMSRCAIDSLDKQSGWKLSLGLVEKCIQTKVFVLLHIERKAQKFDANKDTNLRWCKIIRQASLPRENWAPQFEPVNL